MEDEDVIEEVEALEAILMEGVTVTKVPGSDRPVKVELALHPLTASDDEKKYVSLTLVFRLSPDYPNESPSLRISNPRGLDENSVNGLMKDLRTKCSDFLGHPVLYELVELCREFLTISNVPACPCAVCLLDILSEDVFIKTACYHYFHSVCYGRYVSNEMTMMKSGREPVIPGSSSSSENKEEVTIRCPVCREIVIPDLRDFDLDHFLNCSPPVAEMEEKEFHLTKDLEDLQKKMKALYLKQKEKGGIIDVEAEEKKFLVLTSSNHHHQQSSPQSPSEPPPKPQKPRPKFNRSWKKGPKQQKQVVEVERNEEEKQLQKPVNRKQSRYHSHNSSRHQKYKMSKQIAAASSSTTSSTSESRNEVAGSAL